MLYNEEPYFSVHSLLDFQLKSRGDETVDSNYLSDNLFFNTIMAERRSSTKVNYLSVFEDTLSQCISNSYILDSILSSKKSFQVYKSPIEIYDLPKNKKKTIYFY